MRGGDRVEHVLPPEARHVCVSREGGDVSVETGEPHLHPVDPARVTAARARRRCRPCGSQSPRGGNQSPRGGNDRIHRPRVSASYGLRARRYASSPSRSASKKSARVRRPLHVQVQDHDAISASGVAATVARVLGDRRGWRAVAGVRFVPVTAEQLRKGAAGGHPRHRGEPVADGSVVCPARDRGCVVVLAARAGRAQRRAMGARRYRGLSRVLVNQEVGHGLGQGMRVVLGAARGRR